MEAENRRCKLMDRNVSRDRNEDMNQTPLPRHEPLEIEEKNVQCTIAEDTAILRDDRYCLMTDFFSRKSLSRMLSTRSRHHALKPLTRWFSTRRVVREVVG